VSRSRVGTVAVAVAASATVLAYLLLRLPGWELVAVVGATLLPAGLVLYGGGLRRASAEVRRTQGEVVAQRDIALREVQRSTEANIELQRANAAMSERVAELTALNEISVALSTTLDMDELIDRALAAVVTNLRFDRALVLLADDERGVLTGGRAVGGTSEMVERIATLELPLDLTESQLVALYHADGPLLFRDVDQDPHEANRSLARSLGVTSFVGTPIMTTTRAVGILAVDNQGTNRPLGPGDGPLLYTLGNLLGAAIENARLYAEVEEQKRVLEERVAQRTSQLAAAMEEAQAARAQAEAATASKSAFLASVSHELRTPLTSIIGFTRINQRRLSEVIVPAVASDDPKVERAVRQVGGNLEIMAEEGERLATLINDVLDLSKIEAGRIEWKMAPLDMGDVVTRAAAATSALFEQSPVVLDLEVEPALPAVVGDRDRLIQVVINLISNAVKFTRDGSVSCRVAREGDAIVVSVIDTGVGIAPEDRATVFEEFRQVGDTLPDTPVGTGLGLPISRQIVEHHGGRIWLESTVGEGSAFSFSVPVSGPSSPADPGESPG
jgi:signal transduction histidine kinase